MAMWIGLALSFLIGTAIGLDTLVAPKQQQQPPQPPPCSEAAARQFDFWIGDWDLRYKRRLSADKDEWQQGTATNRIERAMDSCVIVENFVDGPEGGGYRGMSVSAYDANAKKWKQTWVDNQGSYLDFVGEFKDGRMVLSREATTSKGEKRIQRMVFHDITKDRLLWDWEVSRDNGATWIPLWQAEYTRKR